MKQSFPCYQSGFTLVELSAVLILISILAVFSVSRWAGGINPNAQVQQLASDVRYTQSLAMTHGQRYRLNLGINTYSIATVTGNIAILSAITNASSVTLGTGLSFGSRGNLPNDVIAFDSLGRPYTDNTATTALAADATIPVIGGGITRTIRISPLTGRVIIQ